MISVVTWNVNSIKVRLERVLQFLQRERPDFVCLQELKCTEESFPYEAIKNAGYEAHVLGQKAYNGVAILSRRPAQIKDTDFKDGIEDLSSRFLAIQTEYFTLATAYVPNGQSVDSPKFGYKLEWLNRAKNYFSKNYSISDSIILTGDFNIAPDDRDVYDPIAWKNHIHCTPVEREALANLLSFGFIDTLRIHTQEPKQYTWWDYRELSFSKNKGLRIDLIYATPKQAQKCKEVRIDRQERGSERPSDHVPVIAIFEP